MEEPLENSLGCLLGKDMIAGIDLPPFDISALDDFAIIADDLINAESRQPVVLMVIDDIQVVRTTFRRCKIGQRYL